VKNKYVNIFMNIKYNKMVKIKNRPNKENSLI